MKPKWSFFIDLWCIVCIPFSTWSALNGNVVNILCLGSSRCCSSLAWPSRTGGSGSTRSVGPT